MAHNPAAAAATYKKEKTAKKKSRELLYNNQEEIVEETNNTLHRSQSPQQSHHNHHHHHNSNHTNNQQNQQMYQPTNINHRSSEHHQEHDPTKQWRGPIHSIQMNIDDGIGICGYILLILSYALIVVTVPFSLSISLKVVQEYERAVMFRLGRILPGGAKGPGMFFIVPCIDTYTKVDLRTVTFDVPPQEILTRDSVTVAVDAVVYFRIFDPVTSITNVEDAAKSTQLLAATTLRNVLGTRSLQEILADRESIAHSMQLSLDDCTESWGVRVERVEVKDVRLPVQLQRAMAAEAEAAREARAKVIAAEGEHKASRALKEAAEIINESPIALQLRYLQTLTTIASEKNSTIVFPIPIELLNAFPMSNNHKRSKSTQQQQSTPVTVYKQNPDYLDT